jgi:hypothetical protein
MPDSTSRPWLDTSQTLRITYAGDSNGKALSLGTTAEARDIADVRPAELGLAPASALGEQYARPGAPYCAPGHAPFGWVCEGSRFAEWAGVDLHAHGPGVWRDHGERGTSHYTDGSGVCSPAQWAAMVEGQREWERLFREHGIDKMAAYYRAKAVYYAIARALAEAGLEAGPLDPRGPVYL